ncbi:MAG TPA: hypothetical protein VHQ86_01235 [Candidatus Saccharimonadia bacterium]|jgi:lycopene cyclase domain-containing protein|nr:hypothetical protein [Candidatus Saccharimonadia bacterium]
MRHWLYLASVLVFCGLPIAYIWVRHGRLLWRYRRLFAVMVLLSLIGGAADYFALRWHAWFFEPAQNLGLYFGTALETYVFAICVTIAITSAALVLITRMGQKKP